MIRFATPLAFLVSALYVPGIVGAGYAGRWAVAALALYFMAVPALLFAAYALAVLDFDAAMKWCVVAGCFSLGARLDDETAGCVVVAFAAGIAISGLAAGLQQYAGLRWFDQTNPPGGLFVNKNFMGEAAAMGVVLGMRYSLGAVVLCIPALALSGCRSAWLAALVGYGIYAGWRWKWLGVLMLGVAAAFLVDHSSVSQRFELWRDAAPVILSHLPFGAGSPLEPLHNEFIQALAELGVGAIAPLGVLYLTATADLAFGAAVAVICTFGFPLHLPATAWLIAAMCGHLVGHLPHDERVRFRSARPEADAGVVPSLRA